VRAGTQEPEDGSGTVVGEGVVMTEEVLATAVVVEEGTAVVVMGTDVEVTVEAMHHGAGQEPAAPCPAQYATKPA